MNSCLCLVRTLKMKRLSGAVAEGRKWTHRWLSGPVSLGPSSLTSSCVRDIIYSVSGGERAPSWCVLDVADGGETCHDGVDRRLGLAVNLPALSRGTERSLSPPVKTSAGRGLAGLGLEGIGSSATPAGFPLENDIAHHQLLPAATGLVSQPHRSTDPGLIDQMQRCERDVSK